ncbi:MAG: hypothetical protein KIT09_10680 [Bryobacteraceae bacterium]|nr:hypothetical protein [Bryobacteraceae bacterium]
MRFDKIWSRSRGLISLARHIPPFLAEPLSAAQAEATTAKGVVEREGRFLSKLDRAVYANPRSPYRKLLEASGCEFGDVERLVAADGLDGALAKLAAAGVYLTFEEFKGRVPTVRANRTIEFAPDDMNDPTFRAVTNSRTSGTSGSPIQFGWSFALNAQWATHWCLFFAANGILGNPLIFWTPGNAGAIGPQLACAKFGQRVDGWFVSQEMTLAADRLYAWSRHWICRRLAGLPGTRSVAYHDTAPVLEAVAGFLRDERGVSVNTTPSAAVRLSLAARERGADLSGLVFLLGAEPLTPARRETIEACGARATPLYGSTEAVWTGGQCPHPRNHDEVHVLRDLHAVINAPAGASTESEAPRLLFTSLAPVTSKVILNTDIGDSGVVEYRRCDCLYDRAGCRQTIHTIRSADKLTEFGVTIWVADVYDVLENALPRRYRAAAGDFQLIETRTPAGLPRYVLLAHPRAVEIDEQTLAKVFLEELGRRKTYYGFMTSIWEREKVLEVRRQAPIATSRGKLLPFLRLTDPAQLEPALARSGRESRRIT